MKHLISGAYILYHGGGESSHNHEPGINKTLDEPVDTSFYFLCVQSRTRFSKGKVPLIQERPILFRPGCSFDLDRESLWIYILYITRNSERLGFERKK